MSWLYLLIAGCFEIGFTTCMKLSNGNWKSPWQLGFAASAVLSFVFLSLAVRTIPLGIAYAVWTGLGAGGTIFLGSLFFDDKLSAVQSLLLCNLVFTVVALKLFAR